MTTWAMQARERARSFPSTPVFLFLWLPAGFVLGTLVLLGPVRWWANVCRHFEVSQRVENAGVFVMMGVLFMLSGYTARIITNALEVTRQYARIAVCALVVAITGSAVAAWMHPALMSGSMAHEQHAAQFTFGPYPDEARLLDLKRQGYTVVSLLHPAVVPFEPKLIGDEDRLARKLGVAMVHVPMLPWVSGNAESLAAIKRLASDHSRRFYVHCYLGQDRVRMVRLALEQSGVGATAKLGAARYSIRNKKALERGRVYRLGYGVYVTGYPTDDEFVRYVLNGEIRHVTAFLDRHNAEERATLDRERQLLTEHDMPFDFVEADVQRLDARRVHEIVQRIDRMPKPVLVHAYLSPSSGRSPWADAFIQSFVSRRMSLSPTLFDAPLRNGKAAVVVTHVAAGPRPAAADFRELARRGVTEVIHVGRERVSSDARYAAKAGLRWRSVPTSQVVAAVDRDATFYVYGSGAAHVRAALERAYAKPQSLN